MHFCNLAFGFDTHYDFSYKAYMRYAILGPNLDTKKKTF